MPVVLDLKERGTPNRYDGLANVVLLKTADVWKIAAFNMDDQIELQNACEPDPRGKLLGVRTEQGQRRRPDRAWQCFDRLHAVQAARTAFVRRVELVAKARSYFEPSFIRPRTSAKRTQAPKYSNV